MVDKTKKEPKVEKPKKLKKPKKKQPPKGGKRGRKSLYEALNIRDKLEAIRGWCKEGSTDAELMLMLGVKKDTFYTWKKNISEFSDAIKKGKEISNGELLNSAFRTATGFTVPTVVVVKLKKAARDKEGNIILVGGKPIFEEVAEEFPTTEYIPPNSSMGIFMVKNRMPNKYKDKHEVLVEAKFKLESFMDE